MHRNPSIRILDWQIGPLDLLAAWPTDQPLLLLHSGLTDAERHPSPSAATEDARVRPAPRWSIFASPQRWFTANPPADAEGDQWDPLDDLDAVLDSTRLETKRDPAVPFHGGWIGFIAYELGAIIEPAAVDPRRRSTRPATGSRRSWPLMQFGWCPSAILHDAANNRWFEVGDPGALMPEPMPEPPRAARHSSSPTRAGRWTSSLDADAYHAAVTHTLEAISAGDIFQANITQRLTARIRGSTRDLARAALARSAPLYGAYLELPDGRCVISMSPELMLDASLATGAVRTRPIKGTRPSSAPPAELLDSEKDAAELNMIIDLMRNDLGRVCRFGSVQVPHGREIETHPTVHHGVATVEGALRPEVTTGDLLRATFPAGSVTGAPKIRAMQIIDALEPVQRGAYCGAIGYLGDDGAVHLNVGIRTMQLTGRRAAGRWDVLDGHLAYSVGGGIVADSDPVEEYRECAAKAQVLNLALGLSGESPDNGTDSGSVMPIPEIVARDVPKAAAPQAARSASS